jgi:hypothetical protein
MNIALVIATFALVGITAYYAWQTRRTVNEMRGQRTELRGQRDELARQRDQMIEQESQRRRQQVRALREALVNELRQLLAVINRQTGTGRLYMRLPTRSWSAALGHPETLSDDVREELFQIYDEVERMNAITAMMLADMSAPTSPPASTKFVDRSGLGLERATSLDFLGRRITPVIDRICALPAP